ncbi:hypothetical protein SEEM8284_15155 [Salmonella enterica subsp. enterica serovar Montevideo str. IA_2010008284]|nr:hypothetical protein SEEM8284_15155 [Salmonella enterica subsp. enterica serovar Montevideo str. IA_2010008284]
MKEVEKNEIKRLSDRLDAIRHQQAGLSLVESADKYAELEKEKETLEAEIIRLREVHSQKLSKEAQKLMNLPFRRAITKKEQADMGKLKKRRTRPDRGAPDDGAGPGNGAQRDDRVREERVLNLPHLRLSGHPCTEDVLRASGYIPNFYPDVFTPLIYKFIFNGNPRFFGMKNSTIMPICIYAMNFFIPFSHIPQNMIDPQN